MNAYKHALACLHRGGSKHKMTFTEFLLGCKDSPGPAEAARRYQEYLIDFYGSEAKAEFEENKHKQE